MKRTLEFPVSRPNVSNNYTPSLVAKQSDERQSQKLKVLTQDSTAYTASNWGIKDDHTFHTTYDNQYSNNRSSKIIQRVVDEPYLPETQLTRNLIPQQTPKFLKGRKTIEPAHFLESGKTSDVLKNRKHFSAAKSQVQEYSPLNQRVQTSPGPLDRGSSSGRAIQTLHQHCTQVKEILGSEPDHFENELSHYVQAVDQFSTAGSSNIKKRFNQTKMGKKVYYSKNSPIKEIMSNSYRDVDDKALSKKEIRMVGLFPSQGIRLKASTHRDQNRTTSPTPLDYETHSPSFQDHSFSHFGTEPRTPEIELIAKHNESRSSSVRASPIRMSPKSSTNTNSTAISRTSREPKKSGSNTARGYSENSGKTSVKRGERMDQRAAS